MGIPGKMYSILRAVVITGLTGKQTARPWFIAETILTNWKILNNDLNKYAGWLLHNKMKLNVEKTVICRLSKNKNIKNFYF